MSLAPRSSRRGGPAGLSLKGRALRLLAQREHSRVELLRKLAPHAESGEQLDAVLDELEKGGVLSALRFAQSLAHRRSARFGLRRIEQELGTHRLDDSVSEAALLGLRGTERDRALAAWRKRFGRPGAKPADRARQHRFLSQRGFTAEAVVWVLRHGAPGPDDAGEAHSHSAFDADGDPDTSPCADPAA
jgi:regulatory protein